ncbi:hypothetical protein BKA56DRAFT_620960 [Ilyonectria sp. MPI-CAGE-AT-0026]|nr:hypothetical protein BKA56DRAFT_620960 [Ilyonectria sp. MPI-CAGE-AT-0026]
MNPRERENLGYEARTNLRPHFIVTMSMITAVHTPYWRNEDLCRSSARAKIHRDPNANTGYHVKSSQLPSFSPLRLLVYWTPTQDILGQSGSPSPEFSLREESPSWNNQSHQTVNFAADEKTRTFDPARSQPDYTPSWHTPSSRHDSSHRASTCPVSPRAQPFNYNTEPLPFSLEEVKAAEFCDSTDRMPLILDFLGVTEAERSLLMGPYFDTSSDDQSFVTEHQTFGLEIGDQGTMVGNVKVDSQFDESPWLKFGVPF